jgi:hypothetical protein
MKRSAIALTALGIAAALLVTGCGGGSDSGSTSSTAPGGGKRATAPNAPVGSKVVACKKGEVEMEQLRATAVDCAAARTTMRRWASSHTCTLGKSDSRSSCSLGSFRCQAVRVDRGAAVTCARPGGDVSFIAKAWLLRKTGAG